MAMLIEFYLHGPVPKKVKPIAIGRKPSQKFARYHTRIKHE